MSLYRKLYVSPQPTAASSPHWLKRLARALARPFIVAVLSPMELLGLPKVKLLPSSHRAGGDCLGAAR